MSNVTFDLSPQCSPILDPGFVPAVLWNRAYQDLVAKTPGSQPLTIALERSDGDFSTHSTTVLPEGEQNSLTERYVERLVKFLLWQKGARRVILGGGSEQLANRCKQSGIGSRVRAWCTPDRALVDIDDLVEVIQAVNRLVWRGFQVAAMQVDGHIRVQRVIDQR